MIHVTLYYIILYMLLFNMKIYEKTIRFNTLKRIRHNTLKQRDKKAKDGDM